MGVLDCQLCGESFEVRLTPAKVGRRTDTGRFCSGCIGAVRSVRRFGGDVEAAVALLAVRRCAGCGDGSSRLYVDHDHATGVVRGWLCLHCNTGIGHARESVARLASWSRYLLASQFDLRDFCVSE